MSRALILGLHLSFRIWPLQVLFAQGARMNLVAEEGHRDAQASDTAKKELHRDTLASVLDGLVEGISGRSLFDFKEAMTSRIITTYNEVQEKDPQQWENPARGQVFKANLRNDALRQPLVSWNALSSDMGKWAEAKLTAIAEPALLARGPMVLVRTTDGIFADESTYMNSNGFWYIVAPMHGCYNKNTRQLVAADFEGACLAGSKRRWFVFVVTRGTQGLTESAADVGLYEKSVRKEFVRWYTNALLNFGEWMISKKHSISGWISLPFRAVAWPFFKLYDVATGAEHSKGVISTNGLSDLVQSHVNPHLQNLPNMLQDIGTPEIELHDNAPEALAQIRSWANTAVEQFKADSTQLVEALVEIYGSSESVVSNEDFAAFCRTTTCPSQGEVLEQADSTLVFVGHSMGGAAATIQGIIAQQSHRVHVAVLTSSAPGVHDLSKTLGVRLPRKSWRGSPSDPNQNYDKFVNLVPQHGVVWKVDEPLTEMGQKFCMYFHPPSQSRCSGYSDLGDIISPSCLENGPEGLGMTLKCKDFFAADAKIQGEELGGGCWNREHNWNWKGLPDDLFQRPFLGDMPFSEMLDSTGKARLSSTAIPAEEKNKHDLLLNAIMEEGAQAIAAANSRRDQFVVGLSAKFAKGGVIDLKTEHCCAFDGEQCSQSATYIDYKGDEISRSPCTGAHMTCQRSFAHWTKGTTCWCEDGYFYDPRTLTCSIEKFTYEAEQLVSLTKDIIDGYETEVLKAKAKMKDEQYLLDQQTTFGVPDENYGGALGGWFCTPSGDDSWRSGFRNRMFR